MSVLAARVNRVRQKDQADLKGDTAVGYKDFSFHPVGAKGCGLIWVFRAIPATAKG